MPQTITPPANFTLGTLDENGDFAVKCHDSIHPVRFHMTQAVNIMKFAQEILKNPTSDMKHAALVIVKKFMYSGILDYNELHMNEISQFAHKYGSSELKSQVEYHYTKELANCSFNRVLELYTCALRDFLPILKEKCFAIIVR